MHFLDTWTAVPMDRLAIGLGVLGLAVAPLVIPGWRSLQLAAFGLALASSALLAGRGAWGLALGWFAFWVLVVVALGRGRRRVERSAEARAGRFEAAIVGLALGGAFLVLLVTGVARENLAAGQTRGATLALAVATAGLLHLLLRRHALRAAFGFATLGLGLQLLELEARAAVFASAPRFGPTVLVGTALATALAVRLAIARQRFAGSPWLSDAHALHD